MKKLLRDKNTTTIPVVTIPTTPSAVSTTSGALAGSGTKTDPYTINTANELNKVRDYKNKGAFFILKNDIKVTLDYANDDVFDEKQNQLERGKLYTYWKQGRSIHRIF